MRRTTIEEAIEFFFRKIAELDTLEPAVADVIVADSDRFAWSKSSLPSNLRLCARLLPMRGHTVRWRRPTTLSFGEGWVSVGPGRIPVAGKEARPNRF